MKHAKITASAAAAAKATGRKPGAKDTRHAADVTPKGEPKPGWVRYLVAFTATFAVSIGIGFVFGAITETLLGLAVAVTGMAMVALVIEFLMACVMLATVTIAAVKVWDGIVSGTLEAKAADAWNGAKAWFTMRQDLKKVASA